MRGNGIKKEISENLNVDLSELLLREFILFDDWIRLFVRFLPLQFFLEEGVNLLDERNEVVCDLPDGLGRLRGFLIF